MTKTQAQLIEESNQRQSDFFKRITDKGIDPFEPYYPTKDDFDLYDGDDDGDDDFTYSIDDPTYFSRK